MKYLMMIMISLTLIACESYYVGYNTVQDGISVYVVYKRNWPPNGDGKYTDGNIPSLYPSMIKGKGTIRNTNNFTVKVTQYRTMHSHHNPGTKLVDVYTLMARQEKEVQMSATELFVISDLNDVPIIIIKTTYWKLVSSEG